jgi:hypothetical protein
VVLDEGSTDVVGLVGMLENSRNSKESLKM